MSPRDWKYRLEDIDEAIDFIFQYTKGLEYNSWEEDRKTIDAVIRTYSPNRDRHIGRPR